MFMFAVPLLAAAVAATPAPTLQVAPSALAGTLSSALQKELGAQAVVRSGANAVVHLTREPKALQLRVHRPDGQLLLRRQIKLNEEGERPAIRIAVLLLVEVYERLERSPDAGSKPPPPVQPPAPRKTTGTVSSASNPPAATPPAVSTRPAPPREAPPAGPAVVATSTLSAAPSATATTAALVSTRTATVALPPPPAVPPTETEVPPTETAVPPTVASRRLWLSAGASAGWWARPGTAMLGVQLAAHYDFGRLSGGLRVGVGGLCCHLALTQANDPEQTRVEASPRLVRGLAEVRWRALTVGRLKLSPVAGLGLEWTQVRATATAFIGEPVQETRDAVAGLLRAGGVVHLSLSSRFGVEVGAGIQLRSPRLVVRLPEPFATESGDLDPGLLSPWLEVGARFAAF